MYNIVYLQHFVEFIMKNKQIISIAIVCVIVLLTGIVGLNYSGFIPGFGRGSSLTNEPYVSVIGIYGTIGETSYDVFGNEVSLSTHAICEYIDTIMYDDANKGIFLATNGDHDTICHKSFLLFSLKGRSHPFLQLIVYHTAFACAIKNKSPFLY